MNKEIIKAVHDQDLEKFLNKLGLWEKLQQGLLKCEICGKTITFNNIQGIYKEKNKIKFVCDTPTCYKKLLEKNI
jgi:hypothetical protein